VRDTKQSRQKDQLQNNKIIPFSPATELYSLEAEQSVLGGLMFNDSEWPHVQTILTAEDLMMWVVMDNFQNSAKEFQPVQDWLIEWDLYGSLMRSHTSKKKSGRFHSLLVT